MRILNKIYLSANSVIFVAAVMVKDDFMLYVPENAMEIETIAA